MKKSLLYSQIWSIFFALPVAILIASCDESSNTQAGKAEQKELLETTQEAEGVEAAKHAIERKDEQEAKEAEARKEKKEGGESTVKASSGMFRKK